MRLNSIKKAPTEINDVPNGCKGVHESVLRSYQILDLVKQMIKRGDSIETIEDIICYCEGVEDFYPHEN